MFGRKDVLRPNRVYTHNVYTVFAICSLGKETAGFGFSRFNSCGEAAQKLGGLSRAFSALPKAALESRRRINFKGLSEE